MPESVLTARNPRLETPSLVWGFVLERVTGIEPAL